MRYYSIFTEKGLLDLFNSNVIVDLPPQFVPPLEHEDILAMLRQLRSDIAKDNICGLITRPTQLKLPDYLSISVSAQNKINIDRKSTRLNSSHSGQSRMPSSA